MNKRDCQKEIHSLYLYVTKRSQADQLGCAGGALEVRPFLSYQSEFHFSPLSPDSPKL